MAEKDVFRDIGQEVWFKAEELLNPSTIQYDDQIIMSVIDTMRAKDFDGLGDSIQDKNIKSFLTFLSENKNGILKDGLKDFYDTNMWSIIEFDNTDCVRGSYMKDGYVVYDIHFGIDIEKMEQFMVENSNLVSRGNVPFIFDDNDLTTDKIILDNIEWDISEDDFDDAYDEGYGEMSDWIEENGYADEVENWDEQEKIDRYKEYIADTCGDPDSNIVWYDEGNDLEIEIPVIPNDTAKDVAQMLNDGVDRNGFYWEHINDVLYDRFGLRAVGFDVEAPEPVMQSIDKSDVQTDKAQNKVKGETK